MATRQKGIKKFFVFLWWHKSFGRLSVINTYVGMGAGPALLQSELSDCFRRPILTILIRLCTLKYTYLGFYITVCHFTSTLSSLRAVPTCMDVFNWHISQRLRTLSPSSTLARSTGFTRNILGASKGAHSWISLHPKTNLGWHSVGGLAIPILAMSKFVNLLENARETL